MADNNKVTIISGGAGRGQRVMLFLVSFLLMFAGCVLCCSGELWAAVLYLPFIVLWAWNEVEQNEQRAKNSRK